MGAGNYFFRIESMLDGPLSPDSSDCGSGIDENSVQIKKESGALDFGHSVRGKFSSG